MHIYIIRLWRCQYHFSGTCNHIKSAIKQSWPSIAYEYGIGKAKKVPSHLHKILHTHRDIWIPAKGRLVE